MRTTPLLTILSILVVACDSDERRSPSTTTNELQTSTISVPTIQCSMCVETISDALLAVEGVENADVNLKEKTVRVRFLQTKVSVADLERSIANAGYDANATRRNAKAYEELPECCKEGQ